MPGDSIIRTQNDKETQNLNGTYVLDCKIVPPSNTNINYVSTNYVFDNEGPMINLTAPTDNVYKSAQTISVYGSDLSDIASAAAKIVTPDGKDVDGKAEFALAVSNGIISQNVNISNLTGGAYALRVTATDRNGLTATEISKPFFIRNSKPTGTVDVSGGVRHNGRALISDGKIKLDLTLPRILQIRHLPKNRRFITE
ncbi:MAG: hypothetical protein L6V93_22965 [Clostridiales bacterium]|nr:MAG: hypothetical protein L6V93_22965 [Clostridiales bacterium]